MDKIKTAIRMLKKIEKSISQWIKDNDESKFVNTMSVNNKASLQEEIIARNQRCCIYYQTGKTTKSITDNFFSLGGLFPKIEEFLFEHGVSSKEVKDRFDKIKHQIVEVTACRGDVESMSVQPVILFLMPALRDAIQELIRYLRISAELAQPKLPQAELSQPLTNKRWAYVFHVSPNKMRDLRNKKVYHFHQVSPRRWALPKNELPAEYLEKFRQVIPKN